MDPILAKRQLGEINRVLSNIAMAIQECDLAESCGVDCDERRGALEQMRMEANQFKATYFPDAK